MLRLALPTALALLLCACNGPERPAPATVVQLLGGPERFYSKYVSVPGYLSLGRTDGALSLSEADYRERLGNEIYLDASSLERAGGPALKTLDKHYVVVFGRFTARGRCRSGACNDVITDIFRVSAWPDPAGRAPSP